MEASNKKDDKINEQESVTSKTFPVVAIGASAGGIEAITHLFEFLNEKLGMAYVIIQHLSPHHESILPELIERKTTMKVYQVVDGMPLAVDCVYVIPPNAMMIVDDGHLRLSPHTKIDGHIHSIDFFLSSLAATHQEKAIAIILSGTANDGTEGVQAIKLGGGITFAQDKSAKFPEMPYNAIDSGFVDNVMPLEEIAKELRDISKVGHIKGFTDDLLLTNGNEVKEIFDILYNKYYTDFSSYKPNTITRRILRRMNLTKKRSLAEYVRYLKDTDTELELLYNDLLISVTSFFREPELFQSLVDKIFPELFKQRHPSEVIRIWIPACATGEEACSVAIALFEYLGEKALVTPIQIFATDLSVLAIKKARTGVYSKSILQNVSAVRLNKFFINTEHGYQVIKPIRDVCIYATHNLLNDPPFSKMDIISCQNVLIYLDSKAQNKILHSFHYALKPNGYLLLGKSEGINTANDLFVQTEKGKRIFAKTATTSSLKLHFSPKSVSHPQSIVHHTNIVVGSLKNEWDVSKEADKLLLARFIPASVLLNADFQIIRFWGDTANYMQPAAGKASLHILKMVKDELVFDLRSLLSKAKDNNISTKKEGIPVMVNNLPGQISIEIVPLISSDEAYFLVVFKEKIIVPVPILGSNKKTSTNEFLENRIAQLEFQLKESKEHLKMITEDYDTSQEQLQTANEEILSSNEELQSINEELETSKEELQSTNEELTTINDEVQRRNEELFQSLSYSAAIIETIKEPLMILNSDLFVEKVNGAFTSLFGRKREEIMGLLLYDILDGQWDIKELKEKLKQIIKTDKNFENFEVKHSFGDSGEMVLLFNARRLHQDDKKKTKYLVVIEDITQRRHAEELLKESEERLRLIIQNAFDIITIFSERGDIIYESESVEEILGYKAVERIDKNIFIDSIVHPEDKKMKESMFREALNQPGKDIKGEFRLLHKDGTYRMMEAVCINLLDDNKIKGILANYRDITERRSLEKQKEQFIGIVSHELKTPLTSIKGYVQVLEQVFEEDGNKGPLAMLEKMEGQIDRLINLVKDLLDVTQIEEGMLKLKKTDFNLNELIKEVVSEIQPTTKKHTIVMELEPVPSVSADKEKIRQVLVNILSNAIKYSPDGKTVNIRSQANEKSIIVAIKDHGLGMSEETQKKIFDRFFRDVDPTLTTYPGLGLGLHIASEIIKIHNGHIWVKSARNEGSEFFFSLPL